MDRTYAEATGHAPFDWNKWLDAAIADPDSIGKEEHDRVAGLSVKWVTCACGNQCAIIPRSEYVYTVEAGPGSPLDPELDDLGSDFHMAICSWEWIEAKEILRKIEARAAVVIAEELAKLNQ